MLFRSKNLPNYSSSYRFWDPILRQVWGLGDVVLRETQQHYTSRISIQTALSKIFKARFRECGVNHRPTINCITFGQLMDLTGRYNQWVDANNGNPIYKMDMRMFARIQV